LFISANIFFFRFGGWHRGNFNAKNNCGWYQKDSTITR
jgi:hypothetical protein